MLLIFTLWKKTPNNSVMRVIILNFANYSLLYSYPYRLIRKCELLFLYYFSGVGLSNSFAVLMYGFNFKLNDLFLCRVNSPEVGCVRNENKTHYFFFTCFICIYVCSSCC